ncbi:biotin-dependent carboxyltransferase family protein [Pseudomonas sp. PA27(2017)]|uniref:5-oxoprolinase subunit C family protein n=1 Tax=Pseudomonas sp. PA27(2017) TaxID=1932112 RepID=UPI000958EF02|nr:biotin-dependent carboxyltransferase family protein [Pseudomonas sp. PA27(2017)]OLU34697.1 carboxylase [Pseudomonas sp. PA27(2017)]
MTLRVLKPGLACTFQDLGRSGFQHLGVPANGVMDENAHRLANLLVGNGAEQATLEITLQGPELVFQAGTVIALAGADLAATLDGQPLEPLRAVRVRSGAVLAFGKRVRGARAYLAVRDGYRLPTTLGSTSTYGRGAYGGFAGRALRSGDVIGIASGFANPPRVLLPRESALLGYEDGPIRVVAGRQWALLEPAAQSRFLSSAYRIENDSERMGYRLKGEPIELIEPANLLSEAVVFGTVQVPPDGQPIVLMADRQTTGGYPKIASVISVDLPRLAQKLPGEEIRFEQVSLDRAQQLSLARSALFAELEAAHAD